MAIPNTASASLRYDISPAAAGAIATGFLKDLIDAGHLPPEASYFTCDQSQIARAKKDILGIFNVYFMTYYL